MSDSEDEVNIDISQWKPRTVNAAPEPPAPAPRTFASINAPAAAPATTNHLDDDDFDIDALQSKAPTPPPTKTIQKPRQTVQVVITRDPNFNRHDYIDCTYGANIVRRVLKEIAKNQDVYYNVEFVDRHTEQVSILHYYPTLLIRRLKLCLSSHTPTCLCYKVDAPLASPYLVTLLLCSLS